MAANGSLAVALDLDGVLTEHPRVLAHAASARFGELPERAFVDSAGITVPEEARAWVYSADGPAAHLRPAPGAQAFLARLIELCHGDVRIITARAAASSQMTEGWLAREGFPECPVVYADDKPAAARIYGCRFAIEDSLRHARNYASAGITCFLLGDHGSNLPPRIEPIAHLDDVLARLVGSLPVGEAATDRPRIVIGDVIDHLARARLARDAEIVDVDGVDPVALKLALADADGLVVRSETQVTAEVLAAGPKLRVVARAGVGFDNIDVEAATRAGVLVLNAPGANRISAAEHTVALLLAVTRQIPQANASTHAGRWERKQIRPIDLRGRTLGIVGLGRVGTVVAERLRAFEMRVLAHDPHITDERFAAVGAERVSFDELLERSDVISFHCPSTRETHRMLDAAAIERLRPQAIVLNCARGEVVDAEALAAALHAGRIAGAGVDVFPHEPCTASPLFGAPNAVLTPHTGGSSAEALAAVGEMIAETTLAALAGETVPNAVNLPPASVSAVELARLTAATSAAGRLLAVLAPDSPAQLRVTVNGLVPADVTEHATVAALAGALARWSAERATPVNARLLAERAGIGVIVNAGTDDPAIEPSFSFEVTGAETRHVRVSWDRHRAGIVEIDRFSLDRPLEGDVLITHHLDVPGVIGGVCTALGRHGVNVAGMQVGRHDRGGEAVMVVNVDDAIPAEALREIEGILGIATAFRVSLPRQ